MAQVPYVGAQVHYVPEDEPADGQERPYRAATITEVAEDGGSFEPVHLAVLTPHGLLFKYDVNKSTDSAPGTYVWPVRPADES